MTGWAQVNGLNGDTSIFERARFDNYYMEYWSVWMDLVILAAGRSWSAAVARPGGRGIRDRRPPDRSRPQPGNRLPGTLGRLTAAVCR